MNTKKKSGRRYGSQSNSNRKPGRRKYSGGRSGGFKGGRGRNRRYGNKPKGDKIDISRFIQKADPTIPEKIYKSRHAFVDFKFIPQLNQNLAKINYVMPTPIQDQAIPHIMKGKDVVGLASTGTGKTGAFLLPLLHKIHNDKNQKVLIIAPTRELAEQINTEFHSFSRHMNIRSVVCIGGASIHRQIQQFKRQPQVIIGTPGRLQDLERRKILNFGMFNNVVLDEVDRMLDMGFVEIIKDILQKVRPESQLLFFSATMPPVIKKLVHTFLKDPETIEIETGKATKNVEQDIVRSKDAADKYKILVELLNQPEVEKVLIFNETKRGTEKLTQQLRKSGLRADSIHGDKRQSQRQRALEAFRGNKTNILVATDVAARGLDIKGVTHVINYTIPQTYDDYVHRIGRTGRGGKKGVAYTFV